jgi:hypothetical protein
MHSMTPPLMQSREPVNDRWRWTRRLARIGVVGATVLGVGIAFGIGGPHGDALLVAWCFGMPFSFPLAWLPAFSLNAQGTAAATWGIAHILLGMSTVLSWSMFGVTLDLMRRWKGDGGSSSSRTIEPQSDPYLRAAEVEVEAFLRGLPEVVEAPRKHSSPGMELRRWLTTNLRVGGVFLARGE